MINPEIFVPAALKRVPAAQLANQFILGDIDKFVPRSYFYCVAPGASHPSVKSLGAPAVVLCLQAKHPCRTGPLLHISCGTGPASHSACADLTAEGIVA